MTRATALLSGAAGALALNASHESLRQVSAKAPHVDVIAMRAIGKTLGRWGKAPQKVTSLRKMALMLDLASNTLYYAAIGTGPGGLDRWKKAWALGLVAGVGAVALPPVMGLGEESFRRSLVTSFLTVSCYVLGALTTAAVAELKPVRYARGHV